MTSSDSMVVMVIMGVASCCRPGTSIELVTRERNGYDGYVQILREQPGVIAAGIEDVKGKV